MRILVALLVIGAFLLGWTARAFAYPPALGPASVIPAAVGGASSGGEPDHWQTGAPQMSRWARPPVADHGAPLHRLAGIASWGRGWTGVVTRLPRGTRITVCSPRGCWSGRSTGYGPAAWTHRVADLSPAVFRQLCGSLELGLCQVTVSW